jgi:hypothetical protein
MLGQDLLADAAPHLLGSKAHQARQALMTEQQSQQGIDALNTKPCLQPIEQDILRSTSLVGMLPSYTSYRGKGRLFKAPGLCWNSR